jgi:N-acetylglutamate synthase
VDHCEAWNDERGLRRLFALFGPEGFAVDQDPLGRELLGRAYLPFNHTRVMTAAIAALPPELPHPSGARVRLESAPSARWWQTWAAQSGHNDLSEPAMASARAVMGGSPEQLFASLEIDGAVTGVARVAFARGWAGLFALHVTPGHQRSGVGLQLMGAVAEASRARGIRSMYLQVLQTSSPARGLYGRLGFSTHHEYCYLGG